MLQGILGRRARSGLDTQLFPPFGDDGAAPAPLRRVQSAHDRTAFEAAADEAAAPPRTLSIRAFNLRNFLFYTNFLRRPQAALQLAIRTRIWGCSACPNQRVTAD